MLLLLLQASGRLLLRVRQLWLLLDAQRRPFVDVAMLSPLLSLLSLENLGVMAAF